MARVFRSEVFCFFEGSQVMLLRLGIAGFVVCFVGGLNVDFPERGLGRRLSGCLPAPFVVGTTKVPSIKSQTKQAAFVMEFESEKALEDYADSEAQKTTMRRSFESTYSRYFTATDYPLMGRASTYGYLNQNFRVCLKRRGLPVGKVSPM